MTQSVSGLQQVNTGVKCLKLIKYYDRYFHISDDGMLEVYASVKATEYVKNVGITVFLQRYDGDWTTVKQWDAERNSFYCSIHECIDAEVGLEYRIEVFYSANYGDFKEEMVSVQG